MSEKGEPDGYNIAYFHFTCMFLFVLMQAVLLHNTQIVWVFLKVVYPVPLFPVFIESVCRKLGFG